MPIKIKSEPGYYRPIVICDACGKEIDSAEGGTAAWISDEDKTTYDIITIHNNHDCFYKFEKDHFVSDIPLPAFLVYLERGLKFKRKDAQVQAEALSL